MKKKIYGITYNTDTASLIAHFGAIDENRPRLWVYLTPRKRMFYVIERRIGVFVFQPANKVKLENSIKQYGSSDERRNEILQRLYKITMSK